MRIILSESQYNNLLNEINDVKTIKDINWYGLLSNARNVWLDTLQNNVKIPQEYYPYIQNIMVSLGRIKNEIETDVMKGSLSQNTINKFNQNLLSSIVTVSKDKTLLDTISNIPSSQRQMAKSIVGKGIIKSSINKSLNLTGKSFFIDGMIGGLKKYYNPNSPIVKNYAIVLNQMGNAVSNNEQLKSSLFNTIINIL